MKHPLYGGVSILELFELSSDCTLPWWSCEMTGFTFSKSLFKHNPLTLHTSFLRKKCFSDQIPGSAFLTQHSINSGEYECNHGSDHNF